MDLAYLHIVTNHIPIVGVPFALILLLLGIWRKSDELKAVALISFAVLGILTLGVYLLGQGGEDFVEDLAGVSHDAIEDHEKMGLISLISVGITAVLSLIGLIFYKSGSLSGRKTNDENAADSSSAENAETNETEAGQAVTEDDLETETAETGEVKKSYFPKVLIFAVLLTALLSAGILGYTGKLGGKIRHTEFYGGAAETDEEKDEEAAEKEKDAEEPDAETDAEPDKKDADGGGKGRGRGRGGRKQ
jgi:hypothetical protein